MTRAFWRVVYAFYALGGRAVSRRRSRLLELMFLGVGLLQLTIWIYALAIRYSANVDGAPLGLSLGAASILIGLFFRHVRLRSANNAHYLAEKRHAH